MTRVRASSLATGLWRLGALVELPRDMYCSHEVPAADDAALAGSAQCRECWR